MTVPLSLYSSFRIFKISPSRHIPQSSSQIIHLLVWRPWRSLRLLYLGTEHPCKDYMPRATIFGIAMLALGCHDLEMLGLAIDTRDEQWPRALRRVASVGQTTLQTLDVGYSRLSDPMPIAAFLSDVFPWLEDVTSAWSTSLLYGLEPDERRDAESLKERWDEVSWMIPSLAQVREEERNWVMDHGQELPPPLTIEEVMAVLRNGDSEQA